MCFGSTVSKELNQCRADRAALQSQIAELESRLNASKTEVTRLVQLSDSLVSRVESAESDAARFYAELSKAIRVPDISAVLKVHPRTLVDPWTMTREHWGEVHPILTSDLSYYAFSEDGWLALLTPVQAEVKRVLGFPRSEVNDCDNWTLAMCFVIQEAFRRSGLDKQGAFLKLISKPHSYCGFVLPDLHVKVYDPMGGKVVGWLGETGPGDYGEYTYLTEQAFFLS